MMNCIIVDDEPLALDLLEDNIRRVPFLHIAGKCRNAIDAITLLQEQQVDLVFTDIQMPGLSGLQFIESLQTRPMFIFNTAYEQFALDGYKLDVVDYLLKPVSFDRFLLACNKALERFHARKIKDATGVAQISAREVAEFIFLNVDYSLVKIWLDEIKYIESQKDYIKIFFIGTSKKPLLVRHSMKGMEDLLPSEKFMRIHKSFIVNVREITAVRKNAIFIGELEFAVSEQYRDVISKITKGGLSI